MSFSAELQISERALHAAPSPTLAITAKANALKAAGHDIVGFGAGEPDFDTPQNVKDAAVRAIAAGQTKYTPSSGTPALKSAIIAKLARDNGLTYKPNEIIASCGAKHSIYNALQAILNPGDEVLIPKPYWVSYPEQVKLAGGVPVAVSTNSSFLTSAEELGRHITPRTRLLIINSPSNPTGAALSSDALRQIADLVVSRNLLVLSDEIYEKIYYGDEPLVSIASFGDEIKKRTITINGLSKSHSMTGWRIGYAATEAPIVSAMSRIQDQSTSNPCSITQAAAVEALNGPQDAVEMMRLEFLRRRNVIVRLLNEIPGVTCNVPGGAFYVFPKVSDVYGKTWKTADGSVRTITGSDDFAEYLLTAVLVAVVPGSGFGADEYVRLSYATSMANIEKGLARIADAVKALV
jgi:aspartate aminotransferase